MAQADSANTTHANKAGCANLISVVTGPEDAGQALQKGAGLGLSTTDASLPSPDRSYGRAIVSRETGLRCPLSDSGPMVAET